MMTNESGKSGKTGGTGKLMVKDPLEYTEEELRSLTVEELKILKEEASRKETLYSTRQLAEKTMINSLYGAMANKWFPLFNEDIAAAITANGRYFIQKLAKYIEETLQKMHPRETPYVVYGDTDSVYYTIEPFMQKYKNKNPDLSLDEYVDWADLVEKKVIQPIIKMCIEDFGDEFNVYNKDVIGVEREIIADAAVFSEKKKYYARVRDLEGTRFPVDEPYIKIMGFEVIKSTTPLWAKKKLMEAIPHILDKDENDLREWIKKVKKEFTNADLPDIAIIGGVSRLDYDLEKDLGVPIGSRAAIKHNEYIRKNNLEKKYAPIQPGEKCKRIYIVEPNKFDSNIIAFTDDNFCSELEGIVDYDTQFEKGFFKPLELMTNCLGYNLEKETEELDDW